MAGITLAALGIPGVMGYTKIIGMPVITRLDTMLLLMLVFALFGSSRHLVASADCFAFECAELQERKNKHE